VHGFYIEVSNANATKVPDDYRRRQTLKNAERYLTPELKAFEDKALSAQDRALAREKLLYDDRSRRLQPDLPRCSRSPRRSASLDLLAGFADTRNGATTADRCFRPNRAADRGRSPPGRRRPARRRRNLHRQRLRALLTSAGCC
jgi:DNA mismatch repair protein MutS